MMILVVMWSNAYVCGRLFAGITYFLFGEPILGGTQKFPELLKKVNSKYLYKFETLVLFEGFPLRLDAAIPAPLPMLKKLSKIFNRNAVKGRQQFSLNHCNVSKLPPLQILLHPWEPNKSWGAWSGKWGGGGTQPLF
jgi:hypothetical protein